MALSTKEMSIQLALAVERYFRTFKEMFSHQIGKKPILDGEEERLIQGKLSYVKALSHDLAALVKAMSKLKQRSEDLAKEEKALGNCMKKCGKEDKSAAGKALKLFGPVLVFIGSNRIAMDVFMERLCSSIETFSSKAIADVMKAANEMESHLTTYSSSLNWMNSLSNASAAKDPNLTRKAVEVKKILVADKKSYDNKKRDTLEKINFLSLSHINLLSNSLGTYLVRFCASSKANADLLDYLACVIQYIARDPSPFFSKVLDSDTVTPSVTKEDNSEALLEEQNHKSNKDQPLIVLDDEVNASPLATSEKNGGLESSKNVLVSLDNSTTGDRAAGEPSHHPTSEVSKPDLSAQKCRINWEKFLKEFDPLTEPFVDNVPKC